jgi:hypothetical protein
MLSPRHCVDTPGRHLTFAGMDKAIKTDETADGPTNIDEVGENGSVHALL